MSLRCNLNFIKSIKKSFFIKFETIILLYKIKAKYIVKYSFYWFNNLLCTSNKYFFNLICLKRKKSEIFFFKAFIFHLKIDFTFPLFLPCSMWTFQALLFVHAQPTDLRQFQTFSNKFICFQIAMSRAVTGGWKLFILASETSFCSESSN